MTPQEFAATIRSKHPGSYDDIDDNTLTQKVLAKYPQYSDMVMQDTPGALKSGALGVMSGIPGAETAISAGEAAFTPKTYEEAHQGLEQAKNQAWEAHPVAYGTGKTAGIVGTTLLAPEVEGLGGAAALGAGLGAASGADVANKPSDIPLDVLKGAGTGAVTGGVMHGVGQAITKGLPAVGKGLVASLGKPTLEDVQSYLDNPEAIRSALTNPQMAEKLASVTQDIGKASGHLSQEARDVLSSKNIALSARDLKDVAMDTMQKYFTEGNPATAADETSIKAIVDQYQKLAQIAQDNNGTVPETTLRSMIDRLQAATKDNTYGNPEASATQTALKEFGGKLNDALRETNPEYATKMEPSAELAGLSSDIKGKFNLDPNATDTTIGKMGNILNENKTESQDLLQQLKEKTGIDFLDEARKVRTAQNFSSDAPSQGMNVASHATGYGLGALTNLPGGRLIGSLLGGMVGHNIPGGPIAKRILDTYLAGSDAFMSSDLAPVLAKYGPILVNAAKTGGNELAATHFVLGTSDPDYQKLMDHMGGQ